MSLVVRLQGLPAVADSFDIRQFFCGLNIPRGGVYITGGRYGEAYIIFETYEDAQHALSLSGRPLKESYVHLRYSNEGEMRSALELYQTGPSPSVSSSNSPKVNTSAPERKKVPTFSYLCIRMLPLHAKRRDILEFFKGLLVEDVLYLKRIKNYKLGRAIVKFAKLTDASEAARLNMRPLCYSPVVLKLSDEEEWNFHGGDAVARRQHFTPHSSCHERRRSRSRSPVRRRRTSRELPYVREYYVHLINLSYRVEKSDIRHFFYGCDLKDAHITFLVDKEGRRTREGFAMLPTETEYRRAVSMDRGTLKDRTINILPISKNAMSELISRMKLRVCKDHSDKRASPRRSSQERKYLYLRNFASDVTKADVQKFFTGQTVKEDDIFLLCDNKGTGLGEALVTFGDEREASKAEKQNNQTHLGIKIVVSRITETQMTPLKEADQVEHAIVSEADDTPDVTSDSPPNMQTNGESSAPDSSEVPMSSDSQSVTPADKESEVPSGSDFVPTTPLIQNSPIEESPDSANGCHEESTCEGEKTKTSDAALLFVRNLPVSVTAAEILDFFHDYKVSSVNLRNIERGIAIVRMRTHAEAESAVMALDKRELGQKPVSLTLT